MKTGIAIFALLALVAGVTGACKQYPCAHVACAVRRVPFKLAIQQRGCRCLIKADPGSLSIACVVSNIRAAR